MPGSRRARKLAIAITVTVVGLAGILVAEDLPNRHSIESKLSDRSTRALRQAGITAVAVRFTGRDGTVSVLSAAQADQARSIVESQQGVRTATVEVVSALPGTTPVAAGAPSWSPSPSPVPATSPSSSPSTAASPSPSPGTSAPAPVDLERQIAAAGRIQFALGSAVLTGSSDATLTRIAAILKANPGVRVRIEGNTDSTGDAADNQALSEARARAVYHALVRLGINPDRLTTIGYGESRPLVPNTSEANRATNRRVTFRVIG